MKREEYKKELRRLYDAVLKSGDVKVALEILRELRRLD